MGQAQAVLRGREAALAALQVAFGDSAMRGRLVVVRGPAGIGKSTLLDAAVAGWLSRGAQVLSARAGTAGGSADPFGIDPVLRAVRAHFEQLADFRVANSINAVARLAAMADKSPDWWVPRLVMELGLLFDRVGGARRTVLLVDDAHAIEEPALVLTAARRPGCLAVVSCRDDVDPTPGSAELATLADLVIDLRPLSDEDIESILAQSAGAALDDVVLPALRAALGPLFGNPGAVLTTLGDLRARERLVLVRDRLCLRDRSVPIALPAGHPLLDQARGLGDIGIRLLTVVALRGELDVDELPLLADGIGDDLARCGRAVDRLVDLGVLVADSRGRVRCRCDALAASAIEQAGASVPLLHGALANTLLGQQRHGASVDPVVLADHMAMAGTAMALGAKDVAWLVDQADAAQGDEPDRAARWYAAALKFMTSDEPAHARVLTTLLRLLVRTGSYQTLSDVLADPDVISTGGAVMRADLRAAAMLAAVHTGRPVPKSVLNCLGGQQDSPDDPLAFCAWWFDRRATPANDRSEVGVSIPSQGIQPLLSGAELDVVRHALAGDPDVCGRALRRVRGAAPAAEIDRLVEAGSVGDLATVFEIVLGDRYRVPATGVLAAYQRVVRGYANAEWSQAMSSVRELELTGEPGTVAHQAARLFAAEICSARGEFRRAEEWLVDVAPDIRLGALPAWVRAGLLHRTDQPRQAVDHAVLTCRRLRRQGVRVGLEWSLIRALEITMSMDDLQAAAELLAEIEDLHRLGACRGTMEIVFLARGMVHADMVYAQVGADLTKRGGYRPDLIRPWLVLARLADDPQVWLQEAYEVAKQCESSLLREHIRTVSRDRGLTAPRAKVRRESLLDTELRIIGLISEGCTNRQIASDLRISEKTVENYLTRLYARTGCRSRVELAAASLEGRLAHAIAS